MEENARGGKGNTQAPGERYTKEEIEPATFEGRLLMTRAGDQ